MPTSYPPPIDDALTICVHAEAGLTGLPFSVRDGAKIIDISATALTFEIPAIAFVKTLAADPGNSNGRLISLTKAECAAIPQSGLRYVVLDKTDPATPVDLIAGLIRTYQ